MKNEIEKVEEIKKDNSFRNMMIALFAIAAVMVIYVCISRPEVAVVEDVAESAVEPKEIVSSVTAEYEEEGYTLTINGYFDEDQEMVESEMISTTTIEEEDFDYVMEMVEYMEEYYAAIEDQGVSGSCVVEDDVLVHSTRAVVTETNLELLVYELGFPVFDVEGFVEEMELYEFTVKYND